MPRGRSQYIAEMRERFEVVDRVKASAEEKASLTKAIQQVQKFFEIHRLGRIKIGILTDSSASKKCSKTLTLVQRRLMANFILFSISGHHCKS